MCRETVTQHMRIQGFPQASLASVISEPSPKLDAVDPPSPLPQKQIGRNAFAEQFGPRIAEIVADDLERLSPDGHDPLLVPFANTAKAAQTHLNIRDAQPAQLRHAQSRRIHQFNHGLVAQPQQRRRIRLRQQALDLRHAEEMRQTLMDLGGFDIYSGVGPDETIRNAEAVKIPNRHQVTPNSTAVEAALVERA